MCSEFLFSQMTRKCSLIGDFCRSWWVSNYLPAVSIGELSRMGSYIQFCSNFFINLTRVISSLLLIFVSTCFMMSWKPRQNCFCPYRIFCISDVLAGRGHLVEQRGNFIKHNSAVCFCIVSPLQWSPLVYNFRPVNFSLFAFKGFYYLLVILRDELSAFYSCVWFHFMYASKKQHLLNNGKSRTFVR